MSASRFFAKTLKAVPGSPAYQHLLYQAAKTLRFGRSDVKLYLIQTTRPVAYLVQNLQGPAIYLGKSVASRCTDEQLRTLFVRLVQQLKQRSLRLWLGSYFIGLGWRFENLLLVRFSRNSGMIQSVGFFSLLKTMLFMPGWRMGWILSRYNRQWLEP